MASEDTNTQLLALSSANNCLAVKLCKLLAKEEKNVFFSPFSLSTALAMVFCGATGQTADEMREVLGYKMANIIDEDLKSSFLELLDALEKNPEAYTLACANTVLSRKEFLVKEHYKTLLEENFKALLQEVDFSNGSAQAVHIANKWVSEKTNGMIPQLLESLDPNTVMVLLNAVYFKGFWSHKFNQKSTFLQYFYNKGDKDEYKHVDMMHLKEEFFFAEKETFKAIELPYKGDDIAMLILLPNDIDGLKDLEDSLSPTFPKDLKTEMRKQKVEVALPKFRLDYSKSLKQEFQSLGMNLAFSDASHFDGISESKDIKISEIVHKAVLEVNEEGSEAAAATAVGMLECALPDDPEFIVDHPFMFGIYNRKTDLILFMGRVDEL